MMFTAPQSRWLVPFDGTFDISKAATRRPDKAGRVRELHRLIAERDELQRRRFLDRLNTPQNNWKFSSADAYERAFRDDCMVACEQVLQKASRPRAPWYSIPADSKS
jgi:hypothetical protein